MNSPEPIRVVAVGSAHGDDAVAWHVVDRLRECLEGPNSIATHRIDGGQRLLDLLDGQGTLILVDAMRTGGTAGDIRRLTWPDARIESLRPGSTHEFSPAAALRLAETLGSVPPVVVIFGIEIAAPGPQPGLSPEVEVAVPNVVSGIVREVEDLRSAASWKS